MMMMVERIGDKERESINGVGRVGTRGVLHRVGPFIIILFCILLINILQNYIAFNIP